METKYLLVQWPESQHFIGIKDCYFISLGEDDDLELDQAMFVPEDIYNKIMSGYNYHPLYNIDDEFSYWNSNYSKRIRIKITAIIIRKGGVYYEVSGNSWEDEFSEELLKTMYYEGSNSRTSE